MIGYAFFQSIYKVNLDFHIQVIIDWQRCIQAEQTHKSVSEIYLKTFQALNEPILTFCKDGVLQVANSNFIRFFDRNYGRHPEAKRILREVRSLARGRREISKETSRALQDFKMFRLVRDYAEDNGEAQHD